MNRTPFLEGRVVRRRCRSAEGVSHPRRLLATAAAVTMCALGASVTIAADLQHALVSELKAPECITEPSTALFAHNVEPLAPVHPELPVNTFYLVVRYLGDDAIAAAPTSNFSSFPETYPFPPVRGLPLTGLALPDPIWYWQRARRADATMDTSSAFAVHCYDASSFINTWTFPERSITGGGPHAIYGYSFNDPSPPPIFDGNPATDFILQASIEIPWFKSWPDPAAALVPIGQVSLFAYFRDRRSGKAFALLAGIFDNRDGADPHPTYSSFVAHDGQTPFVSGPIDASNRYAILSPYTATYTGSAWSGLRFFRAHVTQPKFLRALADINAYCHVHPAQRYCDEDPATGAAFSGSVTDYDLTDFGVLHEVFVSGSGELSMAVHVYGLGTFNFR